MAAGVKEPRPCVQLSHWSREASRSSGASSFLLRNQSLRTQTASLNLGNEKQPKRRASFAGKGLTRLFQGAWRPLLLVMSERASWRRRLIRQSPLQAAVA